MDDDPGRDGECWNDAERQLLEGIGAHFSAEDSQRVVACEHAESDRPDKAEKAEYVQQNDLASPR